ncbi:ABC transporter ATP-binding protein [Asanoa iriomotensis]|uniref:Sugar ABC transporter ATP-binding protein n=1 Tax=Asanoa iriomotensis TaxID=234613 RepID=A0ABQ4C2Z1_9ACTN|nr:ABC transporter ATP-binding protein [Asanoa iriomotensis]GIF57142.1 sugar ABC transporter ATP-binding protein [Asanoa iriomotensis]
MVAIATDLLTKVFDDGTVAVDRVSLEVAPGEFLVLLGPTGCGKSTILRLVAGLEVPTSGHVLIDGEIVDHLPSRERRLAMVFQDYALYPHLTVAQNIGFPLRVRHETATDVSARVGEVADQLGITPLLRKLPGALSGGERQRVAMARAIIRRPLGFLLDEPLSNLDAGLRAELRSDVAALARRLGVTTVYVTHDQAEAMTMADRVAVLRRGVLQQVGPPEQVYNDPSTLFVAAFLGTPRTSLLEGAVYADGDRVVVDLGSQVIELPADHPVRSRHTDRVSVALRADALTLAPADHAGPVLSGTVRQVEHLGHEALVHVDTGALPTSTERSRLELPGPQAAALMRERPRPQAARTEYGFYPAYDPELPGEPPPVGEVVVRVPAVGLPRRDETLRLAVDLDRLLLFDRVGARIRLAGGETRQSQV